MDDEPYLRARDAAREIADPEQRARLATAILSRGIEETSGDELHRVLTELVHTTRALGDAAQRTAGTNDLELDRAMWRLAGVIGTRLTDEPLPVTRGEALPTPENGD